jgi:kumamolisin
MSIPAGYKILSGSLHSIPKADKLLKTTSEDESITVTLILRRRPAGAKRPLPKGTWVADPPSREEFAAKYGADPGELEQVVSFARAHSLNVVETNVARRSAVLRGSVGAINRAFAIKLNDYASVRGNYRSHSDAVSLPANLAKVVEAVIGLHERPVPATHYSTARRQNPADPVNTRPLTPQQVAQLYDFSPGDGSGQTIGLYEMETGGGPAGYSKEDIAKTIQAIGGGLKTPIPIDVSVDGVGNSGVSDGETGLDITVASAVAPGAKIAVYFTGPTPQNIVHALQRMIHPGAGDPIPLILSISYGWGADDQDADSFSESEYTQLDQLFQDAATLQITVLVSSGDSGAFIASKTQAQTSYPASEPWVLACGGTTIGNISGVSFDEYVWNDTGGGGPGATGGGVSARFPVPSYQSKVTVPKRNGTKKAGRGVPDIAGNASENSGYMQVIQNQPPQAVGGTSAVAPLYAGLLARINANLGFSAGFINPLLYSLPSSTFRNVCSPPGPANNSLKGVTGYPATPGWNACTGLGSVRGAALQTAIQAARKGGGAQIAKPAVAGIKSKKKLIAQPA